LLKLLQKKNWKPFIVETKQKFFAGELDQKMLVYKTLKKKPEDYAVTPPHVRAAMMLADRGTPVRIGNKVGFLKVGPEKEMVIAVKEGCVEKLEIRASQRSYLWRHLFEPIIERFSISKNKTLSDFFGES